MPRVYYEPPPETPPFVMTYSSTEMVIQPPDKFWKKIQEEYVAGYIKKGPTEKDIKPSVALQWKWVPDEEKNATGRKPKAYADINNDQYNLTRTGKNMELGQYLRLASDVESELGNALDEVKRQHEELLKQMEEEQAEKVRQLRMKQEADLAALDAAGKDLVETKKAVRRSRQ